MRYLILILLLGAGLRVFAQGPDDLFTDSLTKRLAGARTTPEKVHFLMELARAVPDSARAEVYAGEAIADAELSRDRWVMADVYQRNGRRYLFNQSLQGNLDKAQLCFEREQQVAREAGLSRPLTDSYALLSLVWRDKGDNEKALAYSNLAMATAVNTDNDSAKVAAYVSLGDAYRELKNMPLAFQHYSEAMMIAEQSRDDNLLRNVYVGLTYFYSAMHEYGKAIDQGMKTYALDRKIGDGVNMLYDLNRVGAFFLLNKQKDLALKMYEQSLALADTLHYGLFKISCYLRIFDMYYHDQEYIRAYHYIFERPEVYNFLVHFGLSFFIPMVRASAFTEEGRYDSAFYYFRQAEPLVYERGNLDMRAGFYFSFGDYFVKRRNYPGAIDCYQKVLAIATAEQDLESRQRFADTLQWLYERAGNWNLALSYNRLAREAGDSLRAKTQETELMKLEVETENRRKERVARDEELNTERRHNIQYMGFTAGLVMLFISIVLLGRLTVPVSVIRTVVFLSFIFLFEFIILLLDKTIQAWTHEEPWKVLCIKIVLAAGLVPLHHWLEHRVIYYLSRRRGPAAVAGHK